MRCKEKARIDVMKDSTKLSASWPTIVCVGGANCFGWPNRRTRAYNRRAAGHQDRHASFPKAHLGQGSPAEPDRFKMGRTGLPLLGRL